MVVNVAPMAAAAWRRSEEQGPGEKALKEATHCKHYARNAALAACRAVEGKHSLMEVMYSSGNVQTKTRSNLPHRGVTRRARDARVDEGRESERRAGRATIPSK